MVGTEIADQGFPESVDLRQINHDLLRFVGNPRLLLELSFQLPLGPTGVADESPNVEALHFVHHCLRSRKVGRELQFSILLRPSQREEGEMLGIDGAAEEDRDIGETIPLLFGKNLVAEKITDLAPDRPIQDIPQRAGVFGVFGQEKHTLKEGGLFQARIGQDEVAFEGIVHGIFQGNDVARPPSGRKNILRENFPVGNREGCVFSLRMQDLIEAVQNGNELSEDQVAAAAQSLLDESLSHEDKADFLAALANRGETASEIAAFANQFLAHAVSPDVDRESLDKPLLDVCGTGGDKLNLFNVSTTSVFLLAAAGVAVVKHGNRGITSKSGGADALEALGIRIDLPPEDFGRCLSEVGAGFLFAPMYHPAFKAVVPVRQLLAQRGQRTIFNILGPLLNPVRPEFQLIGIFDGSLGPVFADILGKLGRERAWTVHGSAGDAGGMDELSTLGPTEVWETSSDGEGNDPRRVDFTIDPSALSLPAPDLADLTGGEAEENAEMISGILEGSLVGPKRDLVTLNSAAGLVITGKEPDLESGLRRANEVLDSGAARETLRKWQNFS